MEAEDASLNVNDNASYEVDMSEVDEPKEWAEVRRSDAVILSEGLRKSIAHSNDAFVRMCTLKDAGLSIVTTLKGKV
ncbi:hypothetical protein G6F43_001701 [Rhizopus delemar]|nr:hypothetical protein G6F43_001701 [Rhizopus delemar]